MVEYTVRHELSTWGGFAVAAGTEIPGNEPGFDVVNLKIKSCEMFYDNTVDPRVYAQVADTDDESSEREFRDNEMVSALYNRNPNWRLATFNVYPNAIRLTYEGRNHDFQVVEISDIEFSIEIDVPVTNGTGSPVETFEMRFSRYPARGLVASIFRSGNRDRYYELYYDDSHLLGALKPTNTVAKATAAILFPDLQEQRDANFGWQRYCGVTGPRLFLEIHEVLPIVPTRE